MKIAEIRELPNEEISASWRRSGGRCSTCASSARPSSSSARPSCGSSEGHRAAADGSARAELAEARPAQGC